MARSKVKNSQRYKIPPTTRMKTLCKYAVLQMAMAGFSEAQIVQELQISPVFVTGVLEHVDQVCENESKKTIQQLRGRAAYRLNHIRQEALEAFNLSKKPRKVTTKEVKLKGKTVVDSKVVQTTEERVPDTSILNTLVNVEAREARLLGLDVPVDLKIVMETMQRDRQKFFRAISDVVTDQATLLRIADRLEELESEEDGR